MVLAMLLPTRCPACGATGPAPCPSCVAGMRSGVPGPLPAGLDLCRSLLLYEGAAAATVARLKYRNDRAVLAWLADGMAALAQPPAGTVVTWAPTSAGRRRRRGFDQAQLLAAALARRWGLPSRGLLARVAGPPQTGRSMADRWRGPSFTPVPGLARVPARSAGSATVGSVTHVLVVDDVMTTGATLSAAASTLRGAGAVWVAALTGARRPRLAPVSLSVPAAPPGVESRLKFFGRSADVDQ